MSILWRAAFLTHQGRVRDNNEDRGLVDEDRGLVIVADGMGGKNAGELASKITVEKLPALLDGKVADDTDLDTVNAILAEAVRDVSQMVISTAEANPAFEGMGATIVAGWLRGNLLHLAHSGDSRAYLFRNDALTQLTEDHTLLAMLIEKGLVGPEDIPGNPAAATLTKHVGRKPAAEPDVQLVDLLPGDRVLMCSDGLTDMVSDEEIRATLARRDEPDVTCRDLVDMANEAGGKDNVTALVLDTMGLLSE